MRWLPAVMVAVALAAVGSGCAKKQEPAGGGLSAVPGTAQAGGAVHEDRQQGTAEGAVKAPDRPRKAPLSPPGVGDAIDYAIGKTAVDQGSRLREKLKDIEKANEEYNRKLEDALGE